MGCLTFSKDDPQKKTVGKKTMYGMTMILRL